MIKKCFLLTHSWRDTRGGFEITIHAAAGDGRPLKAVIDSFKPLFFVARSTSVSSTGMCAQRKSLDLVSMDGTPVDCCYFSSAAASRECAERLRREGPR